MDKKFFLTSDWMLPLLFDYLDQDQNPFYTEMSICLSMLHAYFYKQRFFSTQPKSCLTFS